MYPKVDQASLLEHLETQQMHVIQGLDQLNTRIEATIHEWSVTDDHRRPASPGRRMCDSDPRPAKTSTGSHSHLAQPED